MKLEPPDSHHLRAASGWLELGAPGEAIAELARIHPSLQNHPAVLETGWQIHAALLDWAAAYRLADRCVTLHPTELGGWIHRAYAARRQPGGGLAQAFAALLPAAQKFPDAGMVRYNLACYTAQLGQLDTAWHWLEEAIARDGLQVVRRMGLDDEDLRPLWDRLRNR